MSTQVVPPMVPPGSGPVVPPVAPAPPVETHARVNPAAWGRRPWVRVPSLIVGGLVVALLLALGSFAVINVLVRTTETDATTLTGEVRRAVVHVTGSVDITVGRADRVEIDRRSSFGMTRPKIVETLEDGLLTVKVTCPGGISVICSNDVDLVVPADVSFTIDAFGTSVADVTGDVEINSGAGSVHLERLSGDVDVSVGGGSIEAEDLRGARIQATAGAGSVDLGFLAPPEDVDASSGAGSVLIWLPEGEETYRVDADAGAGSDQVTVKTDPTSDRVIRANAGAGSAEVHYLP